MAVSGLRLSAGCRGVRGLRIGQKSLEPWSVSGACFRFFCALGCRFVRKGVAEDFRRDCN